MKNRIGSIIRSFGYMLAAGVIILATLIPAKSVYAANYDQGWKISIGEIKNSAGTAATGISGSIKVSILSTSGNSVIDSQIKTFTTNPPGLIEGSISVPTVSNNEVKYYAKVDSIIVNSQTMTLEGDVKSNQFNADGTATTAELPSVTGLTIHDTVTATKILTSIPKTKAFKKGTEEVKIAEFFEPYETIVLADASNNKYNASVSWDWDSGDYDPEESTYCTFTAEGSITPEFDYVELKDGLDPIKCVVTIGSTSVEITPGQCDDNDEDGYYEDSKSLGIKLKGIKADTIAAILNKQLSLNNSVATKIKEYNDPDNFDLSLKLIVSESKGNHTNALLDEAKRTSGNSNTTAIDSKCDISLYLYVLDKTGVKGKANQWYVIGKDNDKYKITDLGKSIDLDYTVPSNARSSTSSAGRYFNVFSYHSEAKKLCENWKNDVTTVSFSVSKLSEFALAHYDATSGTTGSSSSSTGSGTGAGGGGDAGSGGGAPKTGDTSEIIRWTYFFVIGITVFLCALILLQDARGYEDRDNE